MKAVIMEGKAVAKKISPWVGALLMGVLSVGTGCHHPEGKKASGGGEAPVTVKVAIATGGEGTRFSQVTAMVEGERDARINSRVQARVESVRIRTGQRVRAGDVLMILSGRLAIDRTKAARARASDAHSRFLRIDALFQKKEASRQEWDEAHTADLVAQADLSAASSDLSLTRIVAPFSGRVALRHVRVGDVVSPGMPLAEILREGNLRLKVHVPESLIAGISPGMKLLFRMTGNGTVTDYPATVRSISPRSDEETHTVLLKADLGRISGVMAGSFGKLLLPSGQEQRILVPAVAVMDHDGVREVYVVESGKSFLRFVRTGHETKTSSGGVLLEVLSGLNAGERVVVSHDGTLLNGAPVHVSGGV